MAFAPTGVGSDEAPASGRMPRARYHRNSARSNPIDGRGAGSLTPDRRRATNRAMSRPGAWRTGLASVVPLAASAIVYAPILGSYFFADDFSNMVRIADSGWLGFVISPMAGHVLIVRNLISCLHYAAFGLDASRYFWCVLATHLLNVWLLFRVLRMLTGRRDVACLGATIWGTSPLHAEPLSWYAVYGHVLTATVLLLVLGIFLPHARRGTQPSSGATIGGCLLLLLGATCFGTGVAIAIATPLAILLMVPGMRSRSAGTVMLLLMPVVTVLMYVGLRRMAAALGEGSIADEATVMIALADMRVVPLMAASLVRYGLTHLLTGAWIAQGVYPRGASWAALAVLGALVVMSVRTERPTGRFAVGTLVLCIATYGIIALGRAHISEVTKMGTTTAATTLRYHYAGTAALTMCLMVLWTWLGRGRGSLAVGMVSVGWLVVYGWGIYRYPIQFDLRPGARRAVHVILDRVMAAVPHVPPNEIGYLDNEPLPGALAGIFGPQLIPGSAALLLISDGGPRAISRPVRFSEPAQSVLAAFRAPRSRWLSQLLVQPHVHLGGDGSLPVEPGCEIRAGKRLLGFALGLLRCEEHSLDATFDLSACREATPRTAMRRMVRCRACVDPVGLMTPMVKAVEQTRWWMRCAAGPDAPSVAMPRQCGAPGMQALQRLLPALFACHRRSVVRQAVIDDASCEQPVVDAYLQRVAAIPADCGECFGAVLSSGLRFILSETLRGVFCNSAPRAPLTLPAD